jgi:hypothetical protein
MSQLAAVARALISIICVHMGCNLKQEKGQQNRYAQGQPLR